MGLPHSSQSMSVTVPLMGLVLAAAGFSPRTLAAISAAFEPSSLSSGTRASICLRSSPVSFFIILVDRHFGKDEQPRKGPRLLSRRIMALPHFSQATVVSILTLGGCGLPSLSRLMMVEQLGSPFSFLTPYPEQPRNSPKRPLRLIISRPQT